MKTLSLKLDQIIFEETEELLKKINKPRNRYINEALAYYNRLQKSRITAKLLALESKLVAEESMHVLKEFENLDDDDSKKE